MAIAITPEKLYPKPARQAFFSVKTTGGALFLASLAMFIAVIASWLALEGFHAKLESDIERAGSEEFAQVKNRSKRAEAELLSLLSQAMQAENLLSAHQSGRKAFAFLEDHVQKEVVFTSLQIDYEKLTMELSFKAPSLEKVAQQMRAFESDVRVRRVTSGDLERRIETLTVGQPPRIVEEEFVEGKLTIAFTDDAFRALSQKTP